MGKIIGIVQFIFVISVLAVKFLFALPILVIVLSAIPKDYWDKIEDAVYG